MHNPTTVLNQLLSLLPEQQFQTFIGQHEADRYVKRFSCWNQLTTMLFAQATQRDSLRDIEAGLRSLDSTWSDLGLQSTAKSTIAYANETRPSAIYESLFYALLEKCEGFISKRKFSFQNELRAIDSTTIDLCRTLFDWAKFRQTKGAIKLHTSLDIRKQIPDVIVITDGKTHDVQALKSINLSQFPKGTIFILDRAYLDFELLWKITQAGHHYVTRKKKNQKIEKIDDHRNAVGTGVMKDEKIIFSSKKGQENYPGNLRMVTYIDTETCQIYEFLTDLFNLSALNIAGIYKARWQVEIFFKWIKQNLKIKSFFGTSENAVKTQIWIAMIYYLLVKMLSACIRPERSPTEITRVVKTVILHFVPLLEVLCCKPGMLDKVLHAREGPQMRLL